ncbi:FAD-dependent oxidoreductase [Ovoidimarina sediminis]|uniref:FAD-dependent oxidoreductase n=1 Tax=Ovoidimarina sediminis TaxID=3079856 RepID=UPI002910B477|nr:FAD-dependent oxidoreductase [Rhodophyticola sp. MJ-SS7]MDU8946740.1 FAD-dependent oxidoreductase [Rhodophyticola sp. MJ-SS7]
MSLPQTDRPLDVLVVGAGIAGMSAAIALTLSGHRVRVFERVQQMGEVGAGLQVSANAGHVYQALGMGEALRERSVPPDQWVVRLGKTGEQLTAFELGRPHLEQHGFPCCNIHRADLQEILLKRLNAVAPEALHLGAEAVGYSETADSVALKMADGGILHGDLLIAADGVRSSIRHQILGPDMAEFSGNIAWRSVVPAECLPEDFMPTNHVAWVGPGRHLVMYWLRNRELMNIVGVVEGDMDIEESWTVRADWREFKADFDGWHTDVHTVIDASDRQNCFRWALNIRKPVFNWSSERAVLIGDAAHPTLPYIAQGAAAAVEDAAILMRVLAEGAEVPASLDRFQKIRAPRAARVVESANRMRRINHMADENELRKSIAKSADLFAERDTWLYNYNPMTVPLTN